jgi:hypothetical protein
VGRRLVSGGPGLIRSRYFVDATVYAHISHTVLVIIEGCRPCAPLPMLLGSRLRDFPIIVGPVLGI